MRDPHQALKEFLQFEPKLEDAEECFLCEGEIMQGAPALSGSFKIVIKTIKKYTHLKCGEAWRDHIAELLKGRTL